MGMEVLAVYDTEQQIETRTTPDVLAIILCENLPQSDAWISAPDEDDPTGKNWTPQWSDIPTAIGEIERLLVSDSARQIAVPGFTTDELMDELTLFRDELRAASAHTSRFYLCVY
jgi:hypothetical protein